MRTTRVWVELYQGNDAVTRPYLCVIASAFQRMGYQVGFYQNGEPYPGKKKDVYVVALSTSVLKLWLRGRRDIVLWAQGIWPEESRLRHGAGFDLKYAVS